MKKTCRLIIGLSILITSFNITVKADQQKYLWPVYTYDDNSNLYPVLLMSSDYTSNHKAIDITAYFSMETVEIRSTKSGIVKNVFTGCINEDAAATGIKCTKAGCKPKKESFIKYDDDGEPVIEVTENNFFLKDYAGNLYGLCNRGGGNAVDILHDDGTLAHYEHLESVSVSAGEYVQQGQLLGYMGSTGYSTGRHVHFGIYENIESFNKNVTFNNNPASADYEIICTDPEQIKVNKDGYCYDKNGVEYVFEYSIQTPQIVLERYSYNLEIDETLQLQPKVLFAKYAAPAKFSYSSSNPKVAAVNESGEITALKSGKTTITISCKELKTSCELEVHKSGYYTYITYDLNGGESEEIDEQKKEKKVPVIITDIIPVREGYVFKGWSTRPKAFFAKYRPGSEFKKNKDTTLYAVWRRKSFFSRLFNKEK